MKVYRGNSSLKIWIETGYYIQNLFHNTILFFRTTKIFNTNIFDCKVTKKNPHTQIFSEIIFNKRKLFAEKRKHFYVQM